MSLAQRTPRTQRFRESGMSVRPSMILKTYALFVILVLFNDTRPFESGRRGRLRHLNNKVKI